VKLKSIFENKTIIHVKKRPKSYSMKILRQFIDLELSKIYTHIQLPVSQAAKPCGASLFRKGGAEPKKLRVYTDIYFSQKKTLPLESGIFSLFMVQNKNYSPKKAIAEKLLFENSEIVK
jgi:hypothetical protein